MRAGIFDAIGGDTLRVPLAPAHLRDPHAGRRRRPARRAEAAGARVLEHDADLHPHQRRAVEKGVQPGAPAGVVETVFTTETRRTQKGPRRMAGVCGCAVTTKQFSLPPPCPPCVRGLLFLMNEAEWMYVPPAPDHPGGPKRPRRRSAATARSPSATPYEVGPEGARAPRRQDLAGFAGAAADALTLFEKFEEKLERYPANMPRAAVELAKDWRSDRVLRRLEALLVVADRSTASSSRGRVSSSSPTTASSRSARAAYALAAARACSRTRMTRAGHRAARARDRRRDLHLHQPDITVLGAAEARRGR